MQPLFVAKRPFDPSAGEAWDRYVAWSGLTQLREIVTLDTMLCPTVPEELVPADWEHNVHADYQVFFFRSLDSGFDFAGFDLVDVYGDVSALTNCGGFEGVFANAELSELGLLTDLSRAQEVQAALRARHPEEPHADCHLWAIWRHALAETGFSL